MAAIAASLGVSPAELQARAEELKAADSVRSNNEGEVNLPSFGGSAESRSDPASPGSTGTREGELTERIIAKVLDAIGPQIRDLLAREVRYAVREELLQRREGR